MRLQNFISVLLLRFFTGFSVLVLLGGGEIYGWHVHGNESVTSNFMAASITDVTVNGSPFCDGQSIVVSYTVSNADGTFDDANFFTAQLSDPSGSFSAPVDIGTIGSTQSGDISAIIPSGTAIGTQYRIRVVSSSPVVTSDPNTSDLIINSTPAAPDPVTATPDIICASASSNLNATSAGNTIRWYTTSTGGSTVGTSASGADFSVTPAVTTIYYAEAFSDGGCVSPTRTMITVTVNPIPLITGTTPGSVCGSGSVTLAATSSNGIINWYADPTGGAALATGTSFTTPVISSSITYYIDATANGCTTLTRTSVTATVNDLPSAPIVGTISPPTCTLPTGSVVLNSLPANGNWTLTRSPGGTTTNGSGTSTTISGLAPGTYTWTVTDASGCTSSSSSNAVINDAPSSPSPPGIGTISQPTCALPTGSVVLNSLPGTGNWTLTRTPGGTTTNGSGTSTTISSLATGTYTWTVTNASGCTSTSSSNVVINGAPSSPSPPGIGTISQPTCALPTGSVVLNSLPATGNWTLTRTPGGTTTNGSGTNTTISGLAPGTYTWTVTNATGCTSTSSSNVVINGAPSSPSPPGIGTISQPTCALPTGSVVLNSLPATGNWTLTRTPGGTTTNGSGTSTTVSGLAPGTYTWTVTNASGCTSSSSSNVVINTAPSSPSAPNAGTITQPTCTVPTGSVLLNSLPGTGNWTLTRTPGGTTTNGSGTSTTISGLATGTYTWTVTNASGCTSSSSSNVVINTAPSSPSAPNIGTITQPTCTVPTGSVVLTDLPGTGNWTLTRTPGGTITNGSGTSRTISGLAPGTYTWTVTNASGCISSSSSNVVINTAPSSPSPPGIGTITQPTCTVPTGGVVLNGLPGTGNWTLTRTPGGTITNGSGTSRTISGLAPGTYTWTVTNASGCTSSSSSNVVINTAPSSPSPPGTGTISQPTCALPTGSIVLNSLPGTSNWTLTRTPGGTTTNGSGTSTTISGLAPGTYTWTVTNASGCTSSSSSNVVINTVPSSPSAPTVGTITQPSCIVSTGSVVLNNLPGTGTWTITITPGGATTTGNGTTTAITGLIAGTYTFTVTASNGCTSSSSAPVIINQQPVIPTAPLFGNITQPTCVLPAGTVVLNSLPSGNWILTRNPGGITTAGSGSTTTISALSPGTYTYTVTNAVGCTSVPSGNVVINPQPPVPGTPAYSLDCSLGFGHAVITINSPVGSGLQYSMDGLGYQSSNVFAAVANGNHFLTVRNVEGCATSGGIFEISCPCINQPVLALSATSGSICGTTAVTITGNTFGGSATSVTISENGAGSVNPASAGTSPFAFTYTPGVADGGRTVVITVTTNNPLGTPCAAAVATYSLTVNANPAAPELGTITNPTCTLETGSVILNGLPSPGTWTLTENPDGRITNGTGLSESVSGLAAGTYNFSVTTEAGCLSPLSANAVINPQPPSPSAPVTGTITHPTCDVSTGSIVLSGLPAQGTWTVTRIPGGVTSAGSGGGTTISAIPAGTYTFTVTNSSGCQSTQSQQVLINDQPPTPPAPAIGHITPPSCTFATGSASLSGLPPTGTWTLTRYPGTLVTTGSGAGTTVPGLATGIYNFTISTNAGCISIPSGNVVIPVQPPTPEVPLVDTIIQPTITLPSGSVKLSGLPASGTWTITRLPDRVTTRGTGASYTIEGLSGGQYTFTLTNSFGCTSVQSASVIVSTPGPPDLIITDPSAVCYPTTVDLTDPGIKTGSTTGLTYSYWTDAAATKEYKTPAAATEGTYYLKGTTVSGFFNIKPVKVTVDQKPEPNAGTDQTLYLQFSTTLDAELDVDETGLWSLNSGSGEFADTTDPKTEVSKLAQKNNTLLWTVSRGACQPVADTVNIEVSDIKVPTLITPNGDQMNEYFEIQGFETLGKTELIVFDKRGFVVFRDSNYDNKWNGVDYNKKPLPDDTYFFDLKSSNGSSKKGYVVIRR